MHTSVNTQTNPSHESVVRVTTKQCKGWCKKSTLCITNELILNANHKILTFVFTLYLFIKKNFLEAPGSKRYVIKTTCEHYIPNLIKSCMYRNKTKCKLFYRETSSLAVFLLLTKLTEIKINKIKL